MICTKRSFFLNPEPASKSHELHAYAEQKTKTKIPYMAKQKIQ